MKISKISFSKSSNSSLKSKPKTDITKKSSSPPPASSTGLTSRSDSVHSSSNAPKAPVPTPTPPPKTEVPTSTSPPKTEVPAATEKPSSSHTRQPDIDTNSPASEAPSSMFHEVSTSTSPPKTEVPAATEKPSSSHTRQSDIDTDSPASEAPKSKFQKAGDAAKGAISAVASVYNDNAYALNPVISGAARLAGEKMFGITNPGFAYPQNANFSDYGQMPSQYQAPTNESGMYGQSGTLSPMASEYGQMPDQYQAPLNELGMYGQSGTQSSMASEYGQMPDQYQVSSPQSSMQEQFGARKLSNSLDDELDFNDM
jgi:hypothetical protein